MPTSGVKVSFTLIYRSAIMFFFYRVLSKSTSSARARAFYCISFSLSYHK